MSKPRVMLLGRLVGDPELHFTPSGERVARFLLTTPVANPLAAEVQQPCLAWDQGGRQLASLVVDHLQAGDLVLLDGRLQRSLADPREQQQEGRAVLLVWDVQLVENSRRSASVSDRAGTPAQEERWN